jgi:hypothetical protein
MKQKVEGGPQVPKGGRPLQQAVQSYKTGMCGLDGNLLGKSSVLIEGAETGIT